MPIIHLETFINAPIERVFDLSRSIDLHKISTAQTKEEAIAGVTSGLIGKGEWVTWRAKHLGITQKLTSKITSFESPYYFADEQVKGAFQSFKHEHYFEKHHKGTLLKDVFEFEAPFGPLGRLANVLFLKNYMRRFLKERNKVLKSFSESERWRQVL